MNNRTKAIIASAAVGAVAATVAFACFIKKHVVIAKVQLFAPNGQDEKTVEDLLPQEQVDATDAAYGDNNNKCRDEQPGDPKTSCKNEQGDEMFTAAQEVHTKNKKEV